MQEQYHTTDYKQTLGFLPKLYVWSIIFESLLFFMLGNQAVTGFAVTIGKALQIVVMVSLLLGRVASGRDIYIVNPRNPDYRYFAMFLALAIVSAVIGLMSGAYTLRYEYTSSNAGNFIAGIIRGAETRPFLEYAIFVYYFIYFAVLPRYLLNSDSAIVYFFRWFRIAFAVCLMLGFADLAVKMVGLPGIPRNMNDWRDVGLRFHGIAGEPRDAFVYMALGLAILNLREYWLRRKKIGIWWISIIVVAALLAQSASGLLGLIGGSLLLLMQGMRRLSIRNTISLLVVVAVIVSAIVVTYRSSKRLQVYGDAAAVLYNALDSGKPVPVVLTGQMNDIYPTWTLYDKVRNGNVFPLLIGSGMGSASVVNNNVSGGLFNGLTNPHSQIIRLIYECGLIGTALLILAFTSPARRFMSVVEPAARRGFLIISYLLVGLFLSHRNTTPFIYLGMTLVVMDLLISKSRSPAISLVQREHGST